MSVQTQGDVSIALCFLYEMSLGLRCTVCESAGATFDMRTYLIKWSAAAWLPQQPC